MEKINVVWFKRDIRTKDHLPLKSALESDLPVLLVYIFEPEFVFDLEITARCGCEKPFRQSFKSSYPAFERNVNWD